MSGSRTVDLIERELDQQEKLMYVHKANGNYAEAQKSRLKIQQLHKDHEARSLYQMNIRHKNQQKKLSEANTQEYASFTDYWNGRETAINQQEEKLQKQMLNRHQNQLKETKLELQHQFSPKVKESSQLLNLREMQRYMVNQKRFGQADKVQQQIFKIEKNEKGAWLQKRNQKIQTALNTLKAKQSTELANLKMRYKNLLDQCITDRKIDQERLLSKHNNLFNDLKSQQDKEVLNYKGQFRSKGGKESPMRTRTPFNS